MNPSPSKEARKRENEQSPIKKKFKDSAISKKELDAAIANGIKLTLQEQQCSLDVAVASAVREAVDSILVPALRDLRTEIQKTNETVKEISSELEKVAKSTKPRPCGICSDGCTRGQAIGYRTKDTARPAHYKVERPGGQGTKK